MQKVCFALFFLVVLEFFFGVSRLHAQYDMSDIKGLVPYVPGGDVQENDREGMMNQFQALFIKQTFLQPAFGKHNSFPTDSDEDEESSDATMVLAQELMINNMAMNLAERDTLHLRAVLRKELERQ